MWEGGVGVDMVVASSYIRVHFIDIVLERAVGEGDGDGEGEGEGEVEVR